MSDDQTLAQEIVEQFPILLIENYCIVATSALLWFDYVLTFPSEYRRIWRRKFTGGTVLFVLMRYATLINSVYDVLEVLVWNFSDRECGVITHMDDALTVVSNLAIATFTILRVYSIWGMDWKPLVLAVPISFYSALALAYENAHNTPVQAGPPFGCLELSDIPYPIASRLSTTTKVASIVAASVVTLLTWIKTFTIVRDTWKAGFSTPLAMFLLRDGTVYFLFLVTCQLPPLLANALSIYDDIALVIWPYFGQVLIVIIHSRFMLDLRGLYFADSGGDEEGEPPSHWSGINFRGVSSAVVGNLGATLDLPAGSDLYPEDEAAHMTPHDSMLREIEAEWADEVPEYCDDPFTTGMKSVQRSDVVQAAAPGSTIQIESAV